VKSNIRGPDTQRGKRVGDFFQWIVAGQPHVRRTPLWRDARKTKCCDLGHSTASGSMRTSRPCPLIATPTDSADAPRHGHASIPTLPNGKCAGQFLAGDLVPQQHGRARTTTGGHDETLVPSTRRTQQSSRCRIRRTDGLPALLGGLSANDRYAVTQRRCRPS
jgi:hypothetical protein